MEDKRKDNFLEMKDITYQYGKGEDANSILDGVNYTFCSGNMYAILGKSGAGKSTTLALLGALDYPATGAVLYNGRDIKDIGYEAYRRNIVSIIFQDYNLLPYLNGYENIALAMETAKGKGACKDKIDNYLKAVGIEKKTAERNVRRISGGEQQRIAIARALAMDSKIILADEPTGNLDAETSKDIIDILYQTASEQGKCVIAVTHTLELAQRADVVLRIEEQKIAKK